MRRLAAVIALCACKGNDKPPPPSPAPVVVADAAPVEDWTAACEAALTQPQSPFRRLAQIIDGCRPYGDWAPILAWETAPADALDALMTRAQAFCTKTVKMQFANEVEEARGRDPNRPWTLLGKGCGAEVSAAPDARFMSPAFFALDRIARAAGANPRLAQRAAAIDIPLPPVSMTGAGYALATSPVMKPDVPRWQITVTAAEVRVGTMPRGKLGAGGIAVDLGEHPYPGTRIEKPTLAADLAAKLPPGERVMLIAPAALPAQALFDVVAAVAGHEVVLAVQGTGGPKGWPLAGIVPVALDAKPDPKAVAWVLDDNVDAALADLKTRPAEAFAHPRVTVAKTATVAHLAKLLGALAFRDGRSASLTNAKK